MEAQYPEKDGALSGQTSAYAYLYALLAHPHQDQLAFITIF
jgi:hypothetical protein